MIHHLWTNKEALKMEVTVLLSGSEAVYRVQTWTATYVFRK